MKNVFSSCVRLFFLISLLFSSIAPTGGNVAGNEVAAAEPAQSAETLPQATPVVTQAIDPAQEDAYEVVQNADPYLMQLALGKTVQASQYGPDRNDPAEGIPTHAYSPFENMDEREVCPPGGCDYVAGRLLVKFAPDQVMSDAGSRGVMPVDNILVAAIETFDIISLKPVFPNAEKPAFGSRVETPNEELIPEPDLTLWYTAETRSSESLGSITQSLMQTQGIDWVEPDFIRKPIGEPESQTTEPTGTSNASTLSLPGSTTDPLYDQQWHLAATHVPEAWAYLETQGLPAGGSRDVVVAVIDTGVDYTHPDLAANIWVNPLEFNGIAGVDDDGNGYVDDIHGADTVYPDGNPMDDHGHGTHVAGIIAAQADNGIGGVGVAYNVQVMPIKAAQYSGVLAASDIAEAIYYAVAKGADVINMSFGGYARSTVEEDALAVAFGQAVLVAAAGNDSLQNEPCNLFKPYGAMYPAAHNWVLGVEASTSNDILAYFSNYDCRSLNSIEYELMAPGVAIWSTLPNNQYAAWSGTSMATPVVSGIAALARSKWLDKDVYSSRFIMGQIASNLDSEIANALSTVTESPVPHISYLEHWLFDTTSLAGNDLNDNDGIVDSGETVDLAIVIRNYWGKADNVNVTLEAWAQGATGADPYVTMINSTVNYGAIGSFNSDDNGLITDEDGTVIGVDNPFRFITATDTPNDHIIPFRLTITCNNGYNPSDPDAPYTFVSYFNLLVQRGFELDRIISEDIVITDDYYWIVPGPILIESGVTVTITGGAQVQWGSTNPEDPYSQPESPYIQVNGTLNILGSYSNPIELFPGEYFVDPLALNANTRIFNKGNVFIEYANILRPELDNVNTIKHCYLIGDGMYSAIINEDYPSDTRGLLIHATEMIQNSHINVSNLARAYVYGIWQHLIGTGYHENPPIFDTVLFNNLSGYPNTNMVDQLSEKIVNSVFLYGKNRIIRPHLATYLYRYYDVESALLATDYINNAFLNAYWDTNINHLLKLDAQVCLPGEYRGWTNNYWGTTSSAIIDAMIYDYYDDFNKCMILYQPILTIPPETAYPFVVDVVLSTTSELDASEVGAEPVTFTVTFNRDMDQSIQPQVSFGPDVPLTDYTVHPIDGGWQDARTWVGTFDITPVTGDGYQLIRVAGAVAADDPWLVTGDDAGRFRFEVITSGTEAMNLQATGGEGYVDLMWTQTDFELLSGFHLYRSTSLTGTYTRINSSIIPPETRSYRDPNVTPGQPYYYKFTVVKSDMTESDFSNTATATPLDTIPPVLVHTPITFADPGLQLSVSASATDNVAVTAVTLFYRHSGDTVYLSKPMVKTTGSTYYATIEGSLLASPGIEYYIEATDGISITRNGRAENPNLVSVDDRPVVTIVTPNTGPSSGGTSVTISGSNFKAGATVTFGGSSASDVVVVSANQVTCTTPAHFPATVDVRLTNPDAQYGVLLNGFTFVSTAAQVSLPNTGGGVGNVVTVPVNAANIQGLLAADLTITYDPLILSAQSATTGSLTAGWFIASNLNTPGEILISMGSPASVDGSGTLATIDFEVIGAPGSTSALTITYSWLNDGAITVETTAGLFSVDNVYNVSGAITFWNGALPVPGTQLSLTGDRVYNALSLTDGSFTIQGAAIDAYVLTASKSDGDNGISAYDASLALQHSVKLITLSGHAALAADVNSNGAINSMDATYILQKAADLISLPFPGSGKAWKFDPAERSIGWLSSNISEQNFTAVLLGDISGNWTDPGTRTDSTGDEELLTASAILTIPGSTVSPGATVDVPITLDITEGNLYGADITITYDPTHVTVNSASLGALAGGWSIATNLSEPGVVKIAIASATPIILDGELLKLSITALGEPGTQSALSLTRGELNESAIPSELVSGRISIVDHQVFLPLILK